ncbi:phosphomannose isomerase type I, partial [Ostertagia ostertagi]
MQRLECHVKKYNWGKRGTESEVARLFAAGHKNFEVDEDETYAEEQAVRLHERDPIHYPDRHHKPELAYALTQEMMERTRRHPALVSEYVDELIECLDNGVRGCLSEATVKVIQKMSVDFPGDVGVFSPLILNHMILKPGECCYYAAEELHAYLSGECVECVGCSNNTIRAAMTPKFIDRDALCEVLNYRMTPPEDYLVPAIPLTDYPGVDEYSPDCKDFQLHRIR